LTADKKKAPTIDASQWTNKPSLSLRTDIICDIGPLISATVHRYLELLVQMYFQSSRPRLADTPEWLLPLLYAGAATFLGRIE